MTGQGSARGAESRGVAAYAAAVASGEPAPGGGSVVAVAAALAAALGEMVCNLAIGRPAYAESAAELQSLADRAAELRARLLGLAPADEDAYRAYLAATRLPRGNDAERAARRAAIEAALGGAADVPLAVMEACRDILTLLVPIARLGNRHALSDVAVGLYLARAAARGAALNVRTNVGLMNDTARAAAYAVRLSAVEGEIGTAANSVTAMLPFAV